MSENHESVEIEIQENNFDLNSDTIAQLTGSKLIYDQF